MSSFPSNFPAGCPFEGAVPADQVVYRVVRNSPKPSSSDFLTHEETDRCKRGDPCLRCGLSVFLTFDDAYHQRDALPFLGDYIAKGTLCSEHGKTLLTNGKQPSHTTWWVYEGVKREDIFESIDERN